MSERDRLDRASELYERAVFAGDGTAVAEATEVLDGLEADVTLARGRIMHARFLEDRQEDPTEHTLFERAAELYRALGNGRGEGEALFWLGTYHQVVCDDNDTALPYFERAHALATQAGDLLLLSYVVRHLGFVDMAAGRTSAARTRLEESVRLRRQVGHLPGVAAGVLALAQLAAADGRLDEVPALLDEATSIAKDSGAHAVVTWIDGFRSSL